MSSCIAGLTCLRCWADAHVWLGELLYGLDFVVGQGVEVAHDAGAVPLVLFHHGPQQQPRVPVAVMITAEQAAPLLLRLQSSNV